MNHSTPAHDPHSEFEDEGIPDLQDGTPEQPCWVDPPQASLPTNQPAAVDDFATTAEEQIEGEPRSPAPWWHGATLSGCIPTWERWVTWMS